MYILYIYAYIHICNICTYYIYNAYIHLHRYIHTDINTYISIWCASPQFSAMRCACLTVLYSSLL